MNFPIKIFLFCPIPEEQKPITQYILFKKKKETFLFFSFAKEKTVSFLFCSFLFCLFFLIFFPSFFSFFSLFLLCFPLSLVLVFSVFLSWSQLQKRFNQARIFYEEASWFDGQLWQKPFFLVRNDRFLSTQQFPPFLQRLLTLLLFFFFTNLVFFLFFLVK